MIPNRTDIQEKIIEYKDSPDKRQSISTWLDSIECTGTDKEKILADLVTYAGY